MDRLRAVPDRPTGSDIDDMRRLLAEYPVDPLDHPVSDDEVIAAVAQLDD